MMAFNEETGHQIVIWESSKLPQKSELMYHFTSFGINLNYMPEDLRKVLPATDSRQRPDQRALENGDLELATLEKQRLEEFQREQRRKRQEAGIEYQAKYFQQIQDNETGEVYYKFSRDYWKDREEQNWELLDDCGFIIN